MLSFGNKTHNFTLAKISTYMVLQINVHVDNFEVMFSGKRCII